MINQVEYNQKKIQAPLQGDYSILDRVNIPRLRSIIVRPGEAIGFMDGSGNSVVIENNGTSPLVHRIVIYGSDLPRAPY